MTPRARRGRECLAAEMRRVARPAYCCEDDEDEDPARRSFRIGRAATVPAEKTNEPTPRSISEVPQLSAFAKRRGKTRKSTARIAMQVIAIMVPR